MKRAFKLLILLLIYSILALSISSIQNRQSLQRYTQTNLPSELYKTHILGGFSIDTPERAIKAAADGVQVAFQYDQPTSESDPLGQKFQSLHIKVVDGYISSLLAYYECHRTKTIKPPPSRQTQYCQNDTHPYLTDENVLLAAVATHLKQVKDNQLIIGYWVLDDWALWDAGSAKQILIDIHSLIQYYTPDRPAICGFGGSIGIDGWDDGTADNFSPQGCDKVGFYIYTPAISKTTLTPLSDAYDWSMSAVLPAMFASLMQRGWNITKEPLIGIGQVFGGPIAHTNQYWVTPNAEDIETQSRNFCEYGATGLTFYAWDDSEFGPTTQTPMDSAEIETGIRNGIAECTLYWSRYS